MALFLQRFTRRKTHGLDENLNEHGGPKLARVLGAFDLVFLGVGSTLGVGVYVLAGEVAKNNAGPAVCISFLIAAFASAFAAVCYAEFGARVPKAGSAYVYSYVTVGELMAFVIGWNLVLEYLIGTASVAKSFSENFDKLVNKSMSNAFLDVFPIDAPGLGPYVDWFAFSVTIVLSGLLAFGMKGSSLFTNVFTVVNLANVLLVIIAGLFFVDGSNWQISFNETDYNETFTEEDVGVGGFAPFGLAGIMDGAATCFFAFVGFDSIAATSEEAKNPKRDIPLAIMTTLVVVFFAYFGVSTVLTLMVPYYLQDPNTPLVSAFFDVGQEELGITVSIGSLFGISASLLGAMIPLPRIIYAMSRDGLVFRILGRIHRQTQTPVLATLLLGLFAAILSMIFDLSALIDMMSIGTLLAYSLVAVSVLIIRFTHDADEDGKLFNSNNEHDHKDNSECLSADFLGSTTNRSQKKAYILIGSYCLLCLGLALILVLGETKLQAGDVGIAVGTAIIAALLAINLAWLAWQPRSKRTVYFMVPLVPLIPCLSILINIYLMMRLSTATWIRFGVWMLVGSFMYLGYGINESSEKEKAYRKRKIQDIPLMMKELSFDEDIEERPLIFDSD
ncbi:hypothetical protein QYM36_015980 [Artemia franciscana]|uniref:Cationic amino acid transporter C-terminal domain-containing protein n=1 Tax=Artemia franciscana TaxID=6661 RepID=A0AA88L2W7_ARTSF|nr:hypothetical protein QYM36_015980 [Artemia franciscana]KAK2705811.1 hypothetical protein QYM36_015980 [Artemia franciscana]